MKIFDFASVKFGKIPSAPYLEHVIFRLLTSETLSPEQNETRVKVGKI